MRPTLACMGIAALAAALLCPDRLAAHEGHGTAAPRVKAQLAIDAAFAPNGWLWLVGVDAAGQLFTQASADAGNTWEAPRHRDVGQDRIAADGENRPRIAFGPERRVVIAYTRPLAQPYSGEIRLLRSDDGGASFAAPITVHQDRQAVGHRFPALAFDGRGVLHAVWIDKRERPNAGSRAGAALYRSESADGGRSFGADIKLAEGVCECCRIALAPAPDGQVAALWRHVFAPNIRDHAFARLDAATAAPVRASFDDWRLDACPHHGPGLAAAAEGYHAVWFGERNGRSAVRYARLAADGSPQSAAREIPDPYAEHADIAVSGQHVAIVWRSHDGEQTQLKAWVSADDGAHFVLHRLAASGGDNDHPRLLATRTGFLVLWRTATRLHVLPIPA